MRELFCAGETGQYGLFTKCVYDNTQTRIKMNQNLSEPLFESLGVGQGKIWLSDHYKIFINSILKTLDDAILGLNIGPLNVIFSCVADDLYLMSDHPLKMQCMLDLFQEYGKSYRIMYGASKTVISVTGSKAEAAYFDDIKPCYG